METVRLESSRRALTPVVRLDEALWAADPDAIPRPLASRLAPLLPSHPFRQHGDVEHFAVRAGGAWLGRVSAIVDRRLRGEIGWFGMLACGDDEEVLGRLIDAAADALRRRSVRRVLGPVDLTIWHGGRVALDGGHRPRSAAEPDGPPALGPRLCALGATPARITELVRYDRFAPQRSAIDEREARAVAAGYRVRALDRRRLADEMGHMHRLARGAFTDSLGFVPLSRAEFDGLYAPVARWADPAMVRVVEAPDGAPCGFALAYPEPGAALRVRDRTLGAARALWALRRARAMVFKTLVVDAAHRGHGLGSLLAATAHRAGARRGCRDTLQGYFDVGADVSRRASTAHLRVGRPVRRRYAVVELPG